MAVREPVSLNRLPDVPDEVYEPPAVRGELLSLVTLRAHLGRCADCRGGGRCATRPTLVKVYVDARDFLAGRG